MGQKKKKPINRNGTYFQIVMRWHCVQEWKTNKGGEIKRMMAVNSIELEDTFPGWYNPPYCLATWPLGNNSTVCCQSNTSTQTHRALRDAPTLALAHSSLRTVGARENTVPKLLRPAHSHTQTQSSITLNWFPSATNREGQSFFIHVRLNLEGREKWKEI